MRFMRRNSPLVALGVVLAALVVLAAAPSFAQKSRRMTADAMKLKGLNTLKTLDADLDGDGKKETIAVGSGDKGVQLALIGENAEGAVVTQVAPPALGKELGKAEVKAMVPPKGSQQIILEVYDDDPDSKVKRVRVYGKGLTELFTSKIERSKSSDDRPAWESDKDLIQYGDPRGGWYFEDLQDDGVVEALVRRKPKILEIPKDGGDPVKLLVGVYEQPWAYDVDKGKYTAQPERLNDFLVAHPITGVEASDAWVEPKELKELKAKALSDALMQATAKEGEPKKSQKELSDDVKIDLQPYIVRGADQKLDTAWIENDAKGDGKGEWLEVTLEEEEAIHMVRLVLGCVDTKQSYKSHNVPESFTVTLDSGSAHEVNRRERGKFSGAVVAFTELTDVIKDKPWAKTTLVFFDGKTEAKKVRITLDKAAKQGKGNLTCISEVSVH